MVTCGARDSAWNGTSTWRVPPRRFARPSTSRATPLFNRVVQVSTSNLEQRLAPLELLQVRLGVRPEIRRQLVQERIERRVRQ